MLAEPAAAHVHATFFLIGQNVARYAGQARAEVAAGDVIGNHSWSHPQLTLLSSRAIRREVDRTQKVIRTATGVPPALMRPPYGAVNSRVLTQLARRDLPAILWNVDTEDWKNRSARVTSQRALAGARPGAIVLMHDIHPTTVQAVPGIVAALKARGFTLVTVPQQLDGQLTGGHAYFGR
ncbi:polysaccharide deacetylase family protein [Cellulomonas sp. MW9]|uniref:Polysaccharide deacetylase family protein n=1 Tax=Cellulomonas edaphi TaxID=3053468 RepID=A0ABT7S2C6_9CELL|nr:polysaccharide deacetylase family protein [Cellulomons edaphi]